MENQNSLRDDLTQKPAIYIAAPYPWKAQARQIEKRIKEKYPTCFDFASDWYHCEDELEIDTAIKDFYQVADCTIFLLLADVWRISTGGSEVEFGLALSRGDKRIMVIGKKYNLFQLLPHVENYSTTEEAIEALSRSI